MEAKIHLPKTFGTGLLTGAAENEVSSMAIEESTNYNGHKMSELCVGKKIMDSSLFAQNKRNFEKKLFRRKVLCWAGAVIALAITALAGLSAAIAAPYLTPLLVWYSIEFLFAAVTGAFIGIGICLDDITIRQGAQNSGHQGFPEIKIEETSI